MTDELRTLRDALAATCVAAPTALVVWLVPFAGVPVLALLTAPVALALTGVWSLSPLALADLEQPARRTLPGLALLLVGGQLAAAILLWTVSTAHAVALGALRGGGASALLPLVAPTVALALPFAALLAGLLLARDLRVAPAVLVAGGWCATAPATANTLLLYAWLGLPLSA